MIALSFLCFVMLWPWFAGIGVAQSTKGIVSEQELLSKVLDMARREEYVQAIDDLTKFLNINPNSIEGNQLLGNL